MNENLERFEETLQKLVNTLDASDLPKKGDVVFNFAEGKPIRVALKPGGKSSFHRTLTDEQPRLEITGDPVRIRAVLEGEQDPRLAFLEGSINVRGDIAYLESVLRSLELMD